MTERFVLKPKYFYDEKNRKSFRAEYTEMPIHEKAMEDEWLAGGSAVATLLLLIRLLVVGGIL